MEYEFPAFSRLTFREETGLTVEQFLDSADPNAVKLRQTALTPTVPITPDMASGVTIGVGYDMSVPGRTSKIVQEDLKGAGVGAELATQLSDGAQKKGRVAQAWCTQHSDLQINVDNALRLYSGIYNTYVNGARKIISGWGGDFNSYPTVVQEVLVDFHYRGDLGLQYASEKLRSSVAANDVAGIRDAICDVEYWQRVANLPRAKDGSPNRRHTARRDAILNAIASAISFPVVLEKKQTQVDPVTAYYHHTETDQQSGFFPIGLFQNLHGGIHVEVDRAADTPLVPVRCLAPGYIVALRMFDATPKGVQEPPASAAARKKGEERNRVAKWVSANGNGFVLVRHDIGQKPDDPDPIVLYSLYFHLLPPRWDVAGKKIPVRWIEKFGRAFGTFQIIDPTLKGEFARLRWTAKLLDPSGKPQTLVSGRVPLFGDTLDSIEKDHAFGKEDRVATAVWRPPSSDIVTVHDALLEGKVVTFHKPQLKVGQGEVLGFADRTSDIDRGFLHWEILAPDSASGVERLLALAPKLGIDAKLFEKFEETGDPNNHFEDGELAKLVDIVKKTLPKDAPAPPATAADALHALQSDPNNLPFSVPPEAPGDKIGFVFPCSLQFDNKKQVKAAASPFSVRLSFRSDHAPGQQVLPVNFGANGAIDPLKTYLPADVEEVTIEPVGFNVQPGLPAQKGDDVEHFKHLATARWRNVWLRHLNEWSSKGLEKSLKNRQDLGEWFPNKPKFADFAKLSPSDQLAQAVASVAFWASPDCVPAPLDGGAADKVFGKMLPENCRLDNPHPITAAWLLQLLHKHKVIHFQQAQALAAPPGKPIYFGWVPALAKGPLVGAGEVMTAVVVEEGTHDGGAIELIVKHGSQQLTVAKGEYTQGLFHRPIGLSFWGEWTLSVKGQSPQSLGDATVHVAKPVLEPAGSLASTLRSGSRVELRVGFAQNCPKELQGLVLLKTSRHAAGAPAGAFSNANLAIPVLARRVDDGTGIRFETGFLKRGPQKLNAFLRTNFTMGDYYKASSLAQQAYKPDRVPVLAEALLDAVQDVRSRSGPLALRGLGADGLSIVAFGQPLDALRKAAADHNAKSGAALKIDAQDDAPQGAPPGLRIAVPAPPPSNALPGGECLVQLNASAAFSKIATGLGQNEVLDVQVGVLFPSGTEYLSQWKSDAPLGEGFVDAALADQLRKAAPDVVETCCESTTVTLQGTPAFGKARLAISGSFLVVTFELVGGSSKFWTLASPQILSGTKPLRSSVAGTPPVLQAKCPLSDARIRGTVKFKAHATKSGIPFNDQAIVVADSDEAEYKNEPALLELAPPRRDDVLGQVIFTARFQATPTDKPFVLKVFAAGHPIVVPIRYAKPITVNRKVFGSCDGDGVFTASWAIADLAHAAPGKVAFTAGIFEGPAGTTQLQMSGPFEVSGPPSGH